MELRIISPRHVYRQNITWAEVHTSDGSFIIQQGHAPTMGLLAPEKPIVFVTTNDKQESHMTTRGIIEIGRNHITIVMS